MRSETVMYLVAFTNLANSSHPDARRMDLLSLRAPRDYACARLVGRSGRPSRPAMCGWAMARPHAKEGDAAVVAGYENFIGGLIREKTPEIGRRVQT